MSHFAVLVIGEDVEGQLAPYHEFECTGQDNEFVQDVDITDEARVGYSEATSIRVRDPDGNLHCPYGDRFYRDPLPTEKSVVGMGSGLSNGISWSSRDWGDGKGYRAKVRYTPEGWAEIEVPRKQVETFAEYLEGYHGLKPVKHGWKPDVYKEHKYGYVLLDEKGNVVKAVNRTNPNAKWDWYVVGGRYAGRLVTKDGAVVNSARKGDIDLQAMLEKRRQAYAADYDEYAGKSLASYMGISEGTTREEFIAQAKAISAFAVVKDGKWYEKGKMGWFACVANEKDEITWVNELERLIADCPSDTLLTVVDCHI